MKLLGTGQAPGVYRRNVGTLAVATVNDGMIPTSFDHIVGADPAVCEAEHRSAGRPVPPWLTVNSYLVESADKLLLVDAGFADLSPDTGLIFKNLAVLGVAPDDIGILLMTHLHADHAAGLVDRRGQATFPRAELVLHEDELSFWRDESSIDRLSEGQKRDFALAGQVLAAYAGRLRPVRTGEVSSGVFAEPTPGHTPGHTAWRIVSGAEQLLIWGDLIHLPGVQFAMPDASVIYDVDCGAAAAARRRMLEMVSADRIPVAGVHLDFPGYGIVTKERNDRYAYSGEVWQPVI